jgi:excisionase family DNA binding protein
LAQRSGIPVRTLRTLVYNGVLPYLRLGHRTIKFRMTDVEKALRMKGERSGLFTGIATESGSLCVPMKW